MLSLVKQAAALSGSAKSLSHDKSERSYQVCVRVADCTIFSQPELIVIASSVAQTLFLADTAAGLHPETEHPKLAVLPAALRQS